MTEIKRRTTLTKIGKLFGVSSSTNLSEQNRQPSLNSGEVVSPTLRPSQSQNLSPTQNNIPASNLNQSQFSNINSSSNDSLKSTSDNSSNCNTSANNSQLNINFSAGKQSTFANDENINYLENDELTPLPKDISSAQNPPSTSKSQPVSRNSSVKKSQIQTNQSVSRSSSLKKASTSTNASPNFLHNSNNSSQINLLSPSTEKTSGCPTNPRFVTIEGGTHEHHLKSAKRQEKLGHMIKDLLGAKKLRDEAISAVPNILSSLPKDKNAPPTLFAGLINSVKKGEENMFDGQKLMQPQPLNAISVASQQQLEPQQNPQNQIDFRSFAEKYGRCQEVVGRGAFGVVRISHKKLSNDKEVLYAVKEFKRKPQEDDKRYSRRLTSEFCISSSLKHINIIHTLDLLQDAKGDYCEVMEFCSGGDLYTLIISAGKLEYAEADCFFKQLIRGVNYMHQMGVSHRDLKPENLLLTENGILKITDFGNGECFKMAWEDDIHLSVGVCGSSPYIAPEEYTSEEFDPRAVDIWACGVIYMAMRTGRQLWKLANEDDEFYLKYLEKRKDAKGYEPIENLKRARCRNVIYSILDPVPSRRITGKQILNSEWGREIKVCNTVEQVNSN